MGMLGRGLGGFVGVREVIPLITYLEPLLAAAVTALEVSGAFVHPDHDGPLLVRPLLIDSSNLSSSSDLGRQIGGRAAVAHNLPVCDCHSRIVVWPLTLDCLWRTCGREALVATYSPLNQQ